MGDKLILNFGGKCQRIFIISHVKLQHCHGNVSFQDGAPGSKMTCFGCLYELLKF